MDNISTNNINTSWMACAYSDRAFFYTFKWRHVFAGMICGALMGHLESPSNASYYFTFLYAIFFSFFGILGGFAYFLSTSILSYASNKTNKSIMLFKISRNTLFRFLALPLCGGIGVGLSFTLLFILPDIFSGEFKTLATRLAASTQVFLFFGFIGVILALIVGSPLWLLVEWKANKSRFRYIIYMFSGCICSLLSWLLIEGAFFSGGWLSIWTNTFFWSELALRRIFLFSIIGLLTGSLYAFIARFIDSKTNKYE